MISEKCQNKLNALQGRIGNTPVVDLGDGVFGKVEGLNPAGSIKDRVGFYIIKSALLNGDLDEDGVIVEATSGNTGIGIAYVARELGLRAIICMPKSMSIERRRMIEDLGAELALTPASEGMAGAVAEAKRIEKSQGAYVANQFGNPCSIEAHYRTTAPELFAQLPDVKHVICGVGSGGTAMGFAKYIRERALDCEVIGVEPLESPLITKGYAGAHKIQGIGANFLPEILDVNALDRVVAVSGDEAIASVKPLYVASGYRCGISSGATFAVANKLREELDGDIAIILPDNGERYGEELYL